MDERNWNGENLGELPKGWVWITPRQIAEKINPGFPSGKHNKEGRGVPHLRPMNISGIGNIDLSTVKYVEATDYESLSKGDVLFNNTNSPEWVGKTSYIRQDGNWAYSNHMTRIRLFREHVNPAWIAFGLHHLFLAGYFKRYCTHHVNQASINSSFLADKVRLPLPPLAEQHRIVTKIEELFSDLDAGVAALQKTKAQLKRYRQAVLKAAVEGKLTAEWRAANKGKIEPASALMERIRAERAKNANSKSKPLPPVDMTELGELPEGWGWTCVQEVAQKIQYGTSEKADKESSGVPIVRMGNIQEGKINFDSLKYLPENSPHLEDFVLEDGDMLFNRTNSAELVGKTAVYKRYHPRAVFASYLIRVKVNVGFYDPDMLSYFINSTYGRRYISSVVSQQVGQANVNGTKLSQMPIPLAPLIEQKQIVAEVERRLSVADEIERTVDASLKQAERLRQSVLKRAFAGKLVSQDPNDEPAERLLERIRKK